MQQVIRILLHGSINICYSNRSEITPVLLMINIVQCTILQYTSTLEVVRRRGGCDPGVGIEGPPRRGRGGGGGGRGGADGLEVVAGQHVGGGAVGAAVAAAAQAVLGLLLGVGAHQIDELRAPAAASSREGGRGGEAEDLLVHELRRVHRAGSPRRGRRVVVGREMGTWAACAGSWEGKGS
jgi:hypothetical protein